MGVDRVKRTFLLFAFFLITIAFAIGQDSMPGMPGMKPEPAPVQQPPKESPPHASHDMQDMPGMKMQHDSEQPVHMMSGTHLEPASTPAPMWMKQAGPWMLMAHGNLFLTGNFQGGPRGLDRFESMNWLMFMEHRKLGEGTLEFRQMLSAEPITLPRGRLAADSSRLAKPTKDSR